MTGRRAATTPAEPGARKIGKRQLRLLIMCASPTAILLTTDSVSDSMVARGLLRETPERPGKSCCITPKGLRALAAEMEAGRVADGLEEMRRDAAAMRARLAAKGEKWIGDAE